MATMAKTKTTGRKIAVVLLAIFTATIASSCGKSTRPEVKGKLPLFPVTGKLLTDGQPMPGAELLFYPVHEFPKEAAKQLPRATVDADGSFKVSTYAPDDGAPAGDYRVTVSWKGPVEGHMNGEQVADLPEKVPFTVQNPRTTKLKVQVKEEQNTLPTWDLAEVERQASNSQ